MRGFTSPLWPIRYKPLPDELLSCWLVRLAHGHGLKVQTFCNLIFGSRRQVWNRDIDRLAPTWLIDELCCRTGTPYEVALNTTLRTYEGLLYPKFRMSGPLQWILVLNIYHRKRDGYGLQFCPACLASDTIPYFRKQWRVACNTICTHHETMLLDRCPKCGMAVAVHRLDMAAQDSIENVPLSYCHACRFDLRDAPTVRPVFYNSEISEIFLKASHAIETTNELNKKWDWEHYAVMHHLCKLMTSRYRHVELREFVLDQMRINKISLAEGHISFEMRKIEERYHLMQLTGWLMVDLKRRLSAAWFSGAVRYNVLMKDFIWAPSFYRQLVAGFSNWRDRLK